jgi:hypothetical protein
MRQKKIGKIGQESLKPKNRRSSLTLTAPGYVAKENWKNRTRRQKPKNRHSSLTLTAPGYAAISVSDPDSH